MKPKFLPRFIQANLANLILFLYSLLTTSLWCKARVEERPSGLSDMRLLEGSIRPGTIGGKASRDLLPLEQSSSGSHSPEPLTGDHRMDWATLESTDFATYVANLRASGCPEETVRRIVTAEVRDMFDRDRIELLDRENIPFWDSGYGVEEGNAPEFERLASEEAGLIASLFGPDALPGGEETTGLLPSAWRLGPALAVKRKAITDILSRADAKRDAILGAVGDGELQASHQEMLAQIEAEKAAAFAATLSPGQQMEFEIRNSALSDELRNLVHARGLRISENQFRAMFQARKAVASKIDEAAISGVEFTGAWANYQTEVERILLDSPGQDGEPPSLLSRSQTEM